MTTLTQTIPNLKMSRPGALLWLAAVGALTVPLVLLSIAIKNNPFPSQDLTVMAWLAEWDVPGLAGFRSAPIAARWRETFMVSLS